ncbi:MAG: DUF4349 domain-containing protein [Bernardetiaceae bacterium]|nr:DUF4349 domain-containing protein [Bernardetiaceae bacterium]
MLYQKLTFYMALMCLFATLCLASCGGSTTGAYVKNTTSYGGGGGLEASRAARIMERKIIHSANLTIVANEPYEVGKSLGQIAEQHNGYAMEIGTDRAIIRVESSRLEDALIAIEALGKVKHKSLSGRDVTEEYTDMQIRLENAEKSRQRYLELLDKAESVEEILQVERELERLNTVIEQLKGKMQSIEERSDFATITVNLRERKKPGLIGYVGLGLYHSVKWLFVRN